MAFVIWREWFNADAVKRLEAMGTLPRNEIEIDDFDMTHGEAVARLIAQKTNEQDFEQFREGGQIVIVEPESIAGTYEITVDYEPQFDAYKSDLD